MCNPESTVEAIFYRAIELDESSRPAFLNEVCGDDLELCASVARLLRHHQHVGYFLDTPVANLATMIDPKVESVGSQIDRYRLLEQIGDGGFGVVFRAEQAIPVHRMVALKIIKPGMDTREVIARFEAERQALAMMGHPNIARAIDAGTTASGRPYFVMELVRGIPITDYCDQNCLSIDERLRLFTDVCHGVQHAHHKGVIHRDIKPSNVMVTLEDDKPVPKIIDFGVAKATGVTLTEHTLFTGKAQMLGTPLYMSPEQAQTTEQNVDTRSDVYSLGVLLYEMLTGTTPFDRSRLKSAVYDELLRIIREEEPPRPSARISTVGPMATEICERRCTDVKHVAQLLKGDLDWIVMRALEKDRNRRYETAVSFAEDIQRYLHNEPVIASPPSTVYRLQKFARRNRASLATVSLVALSLIVGTAVATSQWFVATKARDAAFAATNDAVKAREAAELAESNAEVARSEAVNAYQQVTLENSQRELLDKAERAALSIERVSGWRQQTRSFAIAAHALVKNGAAAAAFTRTLSGLDATETQRYLLKTGRIAFSSDSSKLVLSLPGGGAQIVDVATGELQLVSGLANNDAAGPIGFDATGGALQAVFVSPDRIDVNRLASAPYSTALVRPSADPSDDIASRWSRASADEQQEIVNLLDSIAQSTPDLARIVAWHGIPKSDTVPQSTSGFVCLWDTQPARLVREIPVEQPVLAITPDGSLFGVGLENGVVSIYSADAATPATIVSTGMRDITSIAIAPDRRFPRAESDAPCTGYILAVADKWGTVTIWDLSTSAPLTLFRRTVHTAVAVNFSSDSCMLAVVGHETIRIWDTFNGNHILSLDRTQYRGDVDWSSDGEMICTSGEGADEFLGVSLWKLERDRGIHTLRGLSSSAARVIFSHDSKRIAALTNDWTVGVWEAETASLVRCFKVPPGFFVDNCGMQFSRDGSRLFVSAGSTMTEWNVETGAQERLWELPAGLQDCIGVSRTDRVLLIRRDTAEKSVLLRDMSADGIVIGQWDDFAGRIEGIRGRRDGDAFVLDGRDAEDAPVTIIVYTQTPKATTDVLSTEVRRSTVLAIADDAAILMRQKHLIDDGNVSILTDMRNGQETARLPFICGALSSNGRLGLHTFTEQQTAQLYDIQVGRRVAAFELRSAPNIYEGCFSPDGRFAAWANTDGTISVCDVNESGEALKQVDAGW